MFFKLVGVVSVDDIRIFLICELVFFGNKLVKDVDSCIVLIFSLGVGEGEVI